MDDTGYHYLVDVRLNTPEILSDAQRLRGLFSSALSDFTVLDLVGHKFSAEGAGVTGVFLLAESHLSFHTYPESSYLAIDVFTCGREPAEIIDRVLNQIDCRDKLVRFQHRGSKSIDRALSASGEHATA